MLRFALHRQGQYSQVSTRCHGMPCRGCLQLPNSAELGYRPTGGNVQPSTDRQNGFLPALNDRVCTLVTHGGCAATPKDENGGVDRHSWRRRSPLGAWSPNPSLTRGCAGTPNCCLRARRAESLNQDSLRSGDGSPTSNIE